MASELLEDQTAAHASAGRTRFVDVEIALLVFDRTPEPLDEDLVPPRTLAVHHNVDLGQVGGRELRALVGVQALRLAIASKRKRQAAAIQAA